MTLLFLEYWKVHQEKDSGKTNGKHHDGCKDQ
jgi:hypothetical protein